MPIRSDEHQELVQARLLYTSLIKTVLIAWTKGFEPANPHKDIFFFGEDRDAVVGAVISYFASVPAENRDAFLKPGELIARLPSGAEQLEPVARAIFLIDRAVKNSGRKYARQIAGGDEFETMKNLIAFFEKMEE